MIIDCHSHYYPENDTSSFFTFFTEPDGPLSPERFAACALSQPVDHMLISADPEMTKTADGLCAANAAVASLALAHPRRLSGLCQLNPDFPELSLAEMDRHIANGPLLGVGELCQYILDYPTDDPRIFPLIERAVELDVPILQHASEAAHTAGLDSLASRFPRARFIMAHVGGMYNWPNGIAVALKHDNIWVDTSGCVMLYLGAMEQTMKKLGPSRVLFGVDFPLIKAAPLVAALRALDLPPADFDLVAFKNAAELFHLDSASLGGGT